MIIKLHEIGNETFLYIEPIDILVKSIVTINYDYGDNAVCIRTADKSHVYEGKDANALRAYLHAPSLPDIRKRQSEAKTTAVDTTL